MHCIHESYLVLKTNFFFKFSNYSNKRLALFYRYRGEVLEVIDDDNAKVGLVDVGNFSVIRNIKEMFSMPPEYKGKSLVNILLFKIDLYKTFIKKTNDKNTHF